MSHVYVRALAIGCFYSHISTRTRSEGADRVSGQLRGDKECPFSGVTKSGRVWRKVPESDVLECRYHQNNRYYDGGEPASAMQLVYVAFSTVVGNGWI